MEATRRCRGEAFGDTTPRVGELAPAPRAPGHPSNPWGRRGGGAFDFYRGEGGSRGRGGLIIPCVFYKFAPEPGPQTPS